MSLASRMRFGAGVRRRFCGGPSCGRVFCPHIRLNGELCWRWIFSIISSGFSFKAGATTGDVLLSVLCLTLPGKYFDGFDKILIFLDYSYSEE